MAEQTREPGREWSFWWVEGVEPGVLDQLIRGLRGRAAADGTSWVLGWIGDLTDEQYHQLYSAVYTECVRQGRTMRVYDPTEIVDLR